MPKKPRAARKPTGNKPGRPKKAAVSDEADEIDPSNEGVLLEKVAKVDEKSVSIEEQIEASAKETKETKESKSQEVAVTDSNTKKSKAETKAEAKAAKKAAKEQKVTSEDNAAIIAEAHEAGHEEYSVTTTSYIKEEISYTTKTTEQSISEGEAVYATATIEEEGAVQEVDYSNYTPKEIKLMMKEQKKKEKLERRGHDSWD